MLQLKSSKANPSKDKENQLKGTYTPLLLLSPTTRQKRGWRRHSDNPFSPSSSKTAATTNTIADHILLAANLPLLFPSAESSEDVAIILSDVDELRKKRKKSAAAGTSEEGNMLGRSRQRSRSMERVSKI